MIRRIIVLLTVAFVMLGGAAGAAFAQPSLNQQDKQFLAQAHRSNLAEIRLAQLAEKKSGNQTIQSLARKLVADHSQLDRKVKQEAQKAGVQLPQKPGSRQTMVIEKLSNLNGAAFNNVWVKVQIAGHRQALANINKELRNGSSPDVKKLASGAKPIVQGHLEMLQQIRGGGSESPSPQSTSTGGTTPSGTPSG